MLGVPLNIHRSNDPSVRPEIDLAFVGGTALDSRLTFTRASSATHFNSAGVLTTVGNDVPRFDYHPVTLAPRGLLIESARTNLFLNSATLSTQDVTVTAAAHTLSFYGSGTVTLSGAHSATVNGTGAFPTRTTLTFTPSAGTLTCTVTGTVQYAQVELGDSATSWIPTIGATATRQLDLCTMTLPATYNSTAGTWLVRGSFNAPTVNVGTRMLTVHNVAGDHSLRFRLVSPTGSLGVQYVNSNITQATIGDTVASAGVTISIATAYATDDFAASVAGNAVATDTLGTVPVVTGLTLGQIYNPTLSGAINGCLERVSYWPRRLFNDRLQVLSA